MNHPIILKVEGFRAITPKAPRLALSVIFWAALFLVPQLKACLNDGEDYSFKAHPAIGNEGQFDGSFLEAKKLSHFQIYPEYLKNHYSGEEWRQHLLYLQALLKNNPKPDRDLETSYGVALVHLGKYREALALFLKLEKEKPGLYSNAANLGTTYELLGDNTAALKWIREGLRRDPGSHQGTEWLHVKILEAKLALAQDPSWLETHTVLGLDFGPNQKPVRPEGFDQKISEQTVLALHHQLYERLQFVNPPDAVVGNLLFDLANIAALETNAGVADSLYQFSLSYQPAQKELATKRASHYSFAAGVREWIPILTNWALVISFCALVAYLLWKFFSWIRD